jgi:hypothetical protein
MNSCLTWSDEELNKPAHNKKLHHRHNHNKKYLNDKSKQKERLADIAEEQLCFNGALHENRAIANSYDGALHENRVVPTAQVEESINNLPNNNHGQESGSPPVSTLMPNPNIIEDYKPRTAQDGLNDETGIAQTAVSSSRVVDNGWNAAIEEMLMELEDKSWGYTWMHKRSVNYFSKFHDRLSISNIVFSLISGTSTFATLSNSGLLAVQVGTGIVIYASALLAAIQHFKAYAERIEKHKQAAGKYSTLYHNIKRERTLRIEERRDARDYLTWVTNQYDSLLLSCPDIENTIMDEYVKQYKTEIKSSSAKSPGNKLGGSPHYVVNRSTTHLPQLPGLAYTPSSTTSNSAQDAVNIQQEADPDYKPDANNSVNNQRAPKERLTQKGNKNAKTYLMQNEKAKDRGRSRGRSVPARTRKIRKMRSTSAPPPRQPVIQVKPNERIAKQSYRLTQPSSPAFHRSVSTIFTEPNPNHNPNQILVEQLPQVVQVSQLSQVSQVSQENPQVLRERAKLDLRTPGLRCGYMMNPQTKDPNHEFLDAYRNSRGSIDQKALNYEIERLNRSG